MSTTRLDLYNKALLLCGERFLSGLTESNEPRRLLDHVWSTGWIDACLEKGQWYFAMRTARIEVDADFTTPDFGYQNAFSKPSDWISTSAVCSDEYFRVPLNQYADEMNYWFADIDPLYVKIVSNDETYGGDLSLWPASFVEHAAAHGAAKIIGKLAGDKSEQKRELFGPPGRSRDGLFERSLNEAKNAAALTQPTQIPAQGSWSRARAGRRGWRDGGSRGNLTG